MMQQRWGEVEFHEKKIVIQWKYLWGSKPVYGKYKYNMIAIDLKWGWFQVDLYVYHKVVEYGKDMGVGASFYLVLDNLGSWCFLPVGVGKYKRL